MLPEEWRDNFRMSRDSFYYLCDLMRPFITKHSEQMLSPIEVEKQVAIMLYYLADEGRYHKVANAFGISRAAVSLVVRRVCSVIANGLGTEVHKISNKTGEEVKLSAANFKEKHRFPQCIGATDETQIFIKRPAETLQTS